jgi:hypothetical protein
VRVRPAGSERSGLCLDPHDVCAAELARNEQKDRDYVRALVEAGLIHPTLLEERIAQITDERLSDAQKALATAFVRTLPD